LTPAPENLEDPQDAEEMLAQTLRPLDARPWQEANRAYIARALSELMHERMISACFVEDDGDRVLGEVSGDDPEVRWTFTARRRRLDYLSVDAQSIRCQRRGKIDRELAAPSFFLDLQRTIGMTAFTLARFVEETLQTLYADAAIRARGRPRASDLAAADHQGIERAMEGHPWLFFNKGRIGFGALDQLRRTPESGRCQRLLWLAAHEERAEFFCTVERGGHDEFMKTELGAERLHAFRRRLAASGVEPSRYRLLPVNEWQWINRIAVHYAVEIAARRLVPLEVDEPVYAPQQSIRTFLDASHPERCYIKTALSILNTGQIRGLAPHKVRQTPAMTQWLQARLGGDPELQRQGLEILGEVAAVTYEHPTYAQIAGVPYQYREMLGALWRESATARLRPGESLATMAALLYVDDEGVPFVAAIADRAGVSLDDWLRRYLNVYLRPLLHCFYAHETFFIAHGENTILVLRDGLPERVILKDLVEEVQVSRRVRNEAPAPFRPILYDLEDRLLPLFILTDVFDGFFRYLGDVLATYAAFPEQRFWRLVADTVRAYQTDMPGLGTAFARHDLFVPEFPRFCLNKYRLVYFGYADTDRNVIDEDPRFSGTLSNPIAGGAS
jgi:siderophore synthetase component